MSRPSFISEDNCGFQARSVLVSTAKAKEIMKSIQSVKGYRDPTEDCESIIFPVERPCSVQNLADGQAGLMPYMPWKEKWQWSRFQGLLSGNWEKLRTWRTKVTMEKSKPTKLPSEYGEFSARVLIDCIEPNYWEGPVWNVMCLYSGNRGGERWDSDQENQQAFRAIVDSWSEITGNQHLLSTKSASVRSGWEISIGKSADSIPSENPALYFVLPTSGDDRWLNVPGPREGSIAEFSSCGAQRMDNEMSVKLFEAAFLPLFGSDPVPDELIFNPKNEDLPAFREWAFPAFGGPWLQYILGFATERANPDDITDDIPDWSLYVVGYFKLVGRRRWLILQKEPGGWRLLLTGKIITNPERHQFLREEIARMAGMTSETLWEPQKAGEGWLGVPG